MSTDTADHARLWELIKDTRFGMFTHRHGDDGLLHSHPLTTQNRSVDEDATLYFFVPKDGVIAQHLPHDDAVNVAYANPDDDSYVSVAGRAALVDDDAMKRALFNSAAKAWFPAGADDPNLGLLAVRIESAGIASAVSTVRPMASAATGRRVARAANRPQTAPTRPPPPKGRRPRSIRSPSSVSDAGSTVSAPVTAIATTAIVPAAIEAKPGRPEKIRPAIETMTAMPATTIARPTVAIVAASAASGSRPAARSSRSRRIANSE